MTKFSIGNVIREPGVGGELWIVTDVIGTNEKPIIQLVAFWAENVSAIGDYHDSIRKDWSEDEESGYSSYKDIKIPGWKHAKIEASCVKDYIEKKMKKAMGI